MQSGAERVTWPFLVMTISVKTLFTLDYLFISPPYQPEVVLSVNQSCSSRQLPWDDNLETKSSEVWLCLWLTSHTAVNMAALVDEADATSHQLPAWIQNKEVDEYFSIYGFRFSIVDISSCHSCLSHVEPTVSLSVHPLLSNNHPMGKQAEDHFFIPETTIYLRSVNTTPGHFLQLWSLKYKWLLITQYLTSVYMNTHSCSDQKGCFNFCFLLLGHDEGLLVLYNRSVSGGSDFFLVNFGSSH